MSYTEAAIVLSGGIAALLIAGWAREAWRWVKNKRKCAEQRR